MNKNLTILGAGMAGLLAANMLRRFQPTVIERQTNLPHNHSALLRFRSTGVSDATGIPFKKVRVHKGIWDGEKVVNHCTIPLANRYSSKIANGAIRARSIWNMETEERWIAPDTFIEQMGLMVDLKGGTAWSRIDHGRGNGGPVISTLPMPVMMKMFDFPNSPEFRHFPIYTRKAIIQDVDVYQTIYNASSRGGTWYRATVHGNELTLESSFNEYSLDENDLCQACQIIGLRGHIADFTEIFDVRKQDYGKILPLEHPSIAQDFIVWLTENYNIYSLGRFATWRPLLLDDLVKDIKRIESMISSPSGYQRKLVAHK